MNINIVRPDLKHIVSLAQYHGRMVVVEEHSVVIFTATRLELGRGVKQVSYRIDRVHTLEEARAVLGPAALRDRAA